MNLTINYFVYFLALLPLISLASQLSIMGIQINWIGFPFFIFLFLFSVVTLFKINKYIFLMIVILTISYFYNFLFGELYEESLLKYLRFFITLLPFMILKQINNYLTLDHFILFWKIYFITIFFALISVFLQKIGYIPYFDYDWGDKGQVGRLSGLYKKPNALISFLFPLLIYLLFVIEAKKKYRLQGYVYLIFLLLLILEINLRTASAAVFLIVFSFFVNKNIINKMSYLLIKRHLLMILFIIFLFILYWVYQNYSFLIGFLRGRESMWMAHTLQILSMTPIELLLGRGTTVLALKNIDLSSIYSLVEVHNDYIRILEFHGIFGIFFYFMMYKIIYDTMNKENDKFIEFIKNASIVFFIFMSITVEMTYYSSATWAILAWVFFSNKTIKESLITRKDKWI